MPLLCSTVKSFYRNFNQAATHWCTPGWHIMISYSKGFLTCGGKSLGFHLLSTRFAMTMFWMVPYREDIEFLGLHEKGPLVATM